jgi:hypothetical protein
MTEKQPFGVNDEKERKETIIHSKVIIFIVIAIWLVWFLYKIGVFHV